MKSIGGFYYVRADGEDYECQKQYFILVIVMGVILNLAGSGSVSFAVGYFTFVTAIFAITTISYDEFDNGESDT